MKSANDPLRFADTLKVQHKAILRRTSSTGAHMEVLSCAILIFMGFIILASTSSTWAAPGAQGTAPPPPPPTSLPPGSSFPPAPPPLAGGASPNTVICVVGEGGFCASGGASDLTLSVSPGTAPLGSLAAISPVNTPSPEAVSSQATGVYLLLGHLYQIAVIGPEGQPIAAPVTPPVDLWISYSNDDLARAGGNPNSLIILRYDETVRRWGNQDLVNWSVDPTRAQVHVGARRLGLFALFRQTIIAEASSQTSPTRLPPAAAYDRTKEKEGALDPLSQLFRQLKSLFSSQ